MSICDIRQASCQRSTMDWLACVRPSSAEQPKVEIVSEREFMRRYLAAIEEGGGDAPPADWQRGLAQFRLAPEQYDIDAQIEAQTEEIGAAYFHKGRTVVVIDRGEPMDDENAVTGLIHEFVHAMQDSELQLDDYREDWGKTFDAELAVTGLVEGEAVLYQALAQVDNSGFSPDQIDWEGFFKSWRTDQLSEAELDPAPVDMARFRFPYAFGGGFVTQQWLSAGRGAIDALFAAPPRASRDFLFGATDADLSAMVSDIRERGLPVLAPEFESRGKATLGAWVARMYAARVALPREKRWELARVLGADVFTVQHHTTSGQNLAAWRLTAMPESDLKAWGFDVLEYVSFAGSNDAREITFVSTLPGIPPEPQALEWTSVDKSEMEPETAEEQPRRTPALLCAPRFPADLLREFRRR